jgi:hypothetical protein
MRLAIALVLAPALALASSPVRPQEAPPQAGMAPRTAFAKGEAARIAEEIQGAWMLLEYQHATDVMNQQNVRGSAMFHDGFMTLILQVRQHAQTGWGIVPEFFVQSGMHRYRIDEFLRLQTSSVLGFVGDNVGGGGFTFDEDGLAREHRMTLRDDRLTLYHDDGGWMLFARVNAGQFPLEAIEELDRTRSPVGRDY